MNGGTPKSSIRMRFSRVNHPFWGTPILGNPYVTNLKKTTLGPENGFVLWKQPLPRPIVAVSILIFRKLAEYDGL